MSGALQQAILAVVGFGHQGEAQALNLRDSGHRVVVGARARRAAEGRARAHGFETLAIEAAAARADVIAVLLPDEAVPALWPSLAPAIRAGQTLVFAHGFNLLYGAAAFPSGCDVVLVAPTAPGRVMARAAERGERCRHGRLYFFGALSVTVAGEDQSDFITRLPPLKWNARPFDQ